MSFRLREDTERWFKEIKEQHPFKLKWDIYYYCLLIGLSYFRRSTLSNLRAEEFYKSFADDYKPAQNLIVGLLIHAETVKLGIDLSDKDGVRSVVRQILDASTPTGLSDEGARLMNEYASGGFDVILENKIPPPYSATEFFQSYKQLVDDCLSTPV